MGNGIENDQAVRDDWSGIVRRQQTRLAEIRTNAGIAIAAASLVSSFLGAQALDRDHTAGWTDVALILLPGSIFFSVRALWPVRDASARGVAAWCVSQLKSQRLLRISGFDLVWSHSLNDKLPEGHPTGAISRRDANQRLLDRRANSLMTAMVLLLAQAVIWAGVLVGS
jgi:hypothetical protein